MVYLVKTVLLLIQKYVLNGKILVAEKEDVKKARIVIFSTYLFVIVQNVALNVINVGHVNLYTQKTHTLKQHIKMFHLGMTHLTTVDVLF